MENTEKKEVVIIPEVKIEPNQKDITQTFNELILILKTTLLISLIMLIISLTLGVFRSL